MHPEQSGQSLHLVAATDARGQHMKHLCLEEVRMWCACVIISYLSRNQQ